MPELTSIELGERAFGLYINEKVTEFTMRSESHKGRSRLDLPKLATFRIIEGNCSVSKWPHRITLESECCSLKQPLDIPSLKNSVLPMMFFNSSSVSISSTPLTLQ